MLGGAVATEPDLPPPPLVVRVGDHPLVGTRWPQHEIGDDDALGDGFVLIGPLATTIDVPPSLEGWIRRLPGVDTGGATLLVRPDRLVAAAGDDPHALGAALDALVTGTAASAIGRTSTGR
jgi:hypothetical protein